LCSREAWQKRQPTRVADSQRFPNNDFQLKCHVWCVLYFIMGNRKRGIRNHWCCNGGITHNEVKGLELPRGPDEHLKLCIYIIYWLLQSSGPETSVARSLFRIQHFSYQYIRLVPMKMRRYRLYMLGIQLAIICNTKFSIRLYLCNN